MMNKILIALVLAVVMSGNAYANFITDLFMKEEKIECFDIVEKGRLIENTKDERQNHNDHKIYVYKGHVATYYYRTVGKVESDCLITERPKS